MLGYVAVGTPRDTNDNELEEMYQNDQNTAGPWNMICKEKKK